MKTLQNVLRESLLSNMDDTLDNMEAVTGIIAIKHAVGFPYNDLKNTYKIK